MRRSPAFPVVVVLLAGLVLVGCSSGGDESATSAGGGGAPAVAGAEAGDEAGAEAEPGATGGAGGAAPALTAARVGPGDTLIRTADLTVEVEDVAAAAGEAAAIAERAAGQLQAEERSGTGEDRAAVVVLRVPPAAFDDVLGRLAALGEEQARHVDAQDVVDQLVDLDSRIATQAASVARLRALLDRAEVIGEVVQIEGELTERTAELESLQARLAALEARVDLATVTVRLHSGDGPIAASAPAGFRDGLDAGWDAVVTAGRLVAVVAGVLLPFTPLLLLGVVLVLHRTRSRRAVST